MKRIVAKYLADSIQRPPTAGLAFASLPYIKSVYNEVYKRSFADLEKKWDAAVLRKPREGETAADVAAEQRDEGFQLGNIEVGIEMREVWAGGEEGEEIPPPRAEDLVSIRTNATTDCRNLLFASDSKSKVKCPLVEGPPLIPFFNLSNSVENRERGPVGVEGLWPVPISNSNLKCKAKSCKFCWHLECYD